MALTFFLSLQRFLAFAMGFGVFFLMGGAVFAAGYSVTALDSIAGYGSEIAIKNAEQGSEVVVIIHTPDNKTETFSGDVDSSGNVSIVLPRKSTYEAGVYSFVVVPRGFSFEDGEVHSFEVFPDDPSASLSKIKTENVSLATGKKGEVSVLLQDQYGNKISGHRVQIISSRKDDDINFSGENRTDKNGLISFLISSDQEGNSKISALDQTSGISLSDRKNILFYDNTPSQKSHSRFSASMFGVGGDKEEEESTGEVGLVSEFRIEFPSTVEVNSSDNFLTITAVDAHGNTLSDFTGTVFIRIPDDENADVPGEDGKYTFLKRDEGTFTFSQSLKFSQSGTQTIEVFLYDVKNQEINVNVFGKKTVMVKDSGSFQNPIGSNDIGITAPENNSKFSSSGVSVSGYSQKNSDVKIFLDDAPYKTVSTDDDGEFTFLLYDIEEGEHTLVAHQVEGEKKISSSVHFSVDSSAPEVTNFSFSKTTVSPSEKITLTVKTKGGAKKVSMRIDNEDFSLSQDDSSWKGEFSAPQKISEYPVLVTVTDDYGNETKKVLDTKITVERKKNTEDVLTGKFSEEKNSIILEWKNTLDASPILYLLTAGTSKDTMKKVKSISGSSTRIEYFDFTAGEKVYLSIIPVNAEGKEGSPSNVVSVQTKKKEVVPDPDPIIPVQKDPVFSVQSEDGQVQISWESTKNIDHYEILSGIQSGEYLGKAKKSAFQNAYILQDLIVGKKYFVRLLAKDSLGNTVFDYGEKSIVVGESLFHSAPSSSAPQPYPEWVTQTGPQLFLFIGAMFFIASGVILGRKKKY